MQNLLALETLEHCERNQEDSIARELSSGYNFPEEYNVDDHLGGLVSVYTKCSLAWTYPLTRQAFRTTARTFRVTESVILMTIVLTMFTANPRND